MRPRRAMLVVLVVGCCGCPGVGPKKPNPGPKKPISRPSQSDAIFALDVEVAGLWNSIEQTAAEQNGGGPAPIQTGN